MTTTATIVTPQYVTRGVAFTPNATNRTGSVAYAKGVNYAPQTLNYAKSCGSAVKSAHQTGDGWKQTFQQFPENSTMALNKPAVFGWSWCFWLAIILGLIVLALLVGWFIKAVTNTNASKIYDINPPCRY